MVVALAARFGAQEVSPLSHVLTHKIPNVFLVAVEILNDLNKCFFLYLFLSSTGVYTGGRGGH